MAPSMLHALQAEISGLGDTVAFDMKHPYARVQENNPRAYVKACYHPQATRIVASASNAAQIKSSLMAEPKRSKSISSAMAVAS
jgi:hypothetical protein